MKISTVCLTILVLTTATQSQDTTDPLASVKGGSCGNGCVSCRKYSSIEWCHACRNSKHEMTTAIDGKCTGTESPIANCLISTGNTIRNEQTCLVCATGYAAHYKYNPTATETLKKGRHFTECKKIDDAGTVRGEWITELAAPSRRVLADTLTFVATLCEYGYELESVDGFNKCVISDNQIITADPNCLGWTKNQDCAVCKPGYTKTRTEQICVKVEYNSGMISNSFETQGIRGIAENCNMEIEDLVFENIVGWGVTGTEEFGYFMMDSKTGEPYLRTLHETYGTCSSEKLGKVGEKLPTTTNFVGLVKVSILLIGVFTFNFVK